MASVEERIYDLALGALAEQERQVAELRGRAATLLAAGAVSASLLARSTFGGTRPDGPLELSATIVGLLGAGVLLIATIALLVPYEVGFSVDTDAAYRALWDLDLVDQPEVDLALAAAMHEPRRRNTHAVRRLVRALFVALGALVLQTVGLAGAAALAS